jgi:hypothetical protein
VTFGNRTRRPEPRRKKILQRSLIKKRKGYIYVNNRLEGNAVLTIDGILPKNF